MEARRNHPIIWGLATVVALLVSSQAIAQFGPQQQHVAHSQNFIVFASSPQFAAQASKAAEDYRSKLAVYWLGEELPPWSQRCPVHIVSSPKLGAGGETRFSPIPGGVGNWMMQVQGTEERVLDSVLPHEITHTIFASHFAPFNRAPPFDKYLPRWADEGACTTVEHIEEKSKHQHFLQDFLRTGRGIAFNKMFSLKDYPKDILPLYAQGHSVVQFLLDQGGPRKFVGFLEDGMRTGAWQVAMKTHYEYETIGELQTQWNRWLRDGSPKSLAGYAPSIQGEGAASSIALASATGPTPAKARLGSFERRAPASDVLAQATPSSVQRLEGASYASGASWYRNRLRAVTSGTLPSREVTDPASALQASASTLRAVAPAAGPDRTFPSQPYQAARQPASQPERNTIRVLDWGSSDPVSGIASQPEMVPLMR